MRLLCFISPQQRRWAGSAKWLDNKLGSIFLTCGLWLLAGRLWLRAAAKILLWLTSPTLRFDWEPGKWARVQRSGKQAIRACPMHTT